MKTQEQRGNSAWKVPHQPGPGQWKSLGPFCPCYYTHFALVQFLSVSPTDAPSCHWLHMGLEKILFPFLDIVNTKGYNTMKRGVRHLTIFIDLYQNKRLEGQGPAKNSSYCRTAPSPIKPSLQYPLLFLPLLFAVVPDSIINSCESWFMFNLQKINNNQYRESVSLDVDICKTYQEHIRSYIGKST